MREFFIRFRPVLVTAGVFSLCMNLLLLVPSLYMLQVFDRALSSRNEPTLVMLTVIAIVALLTLAVLDYLRGRLLSLSGALLDQHIGPRVLSGLLDDAARLRGDDHAQSLRDLAGLRATLSGPGIVAAFDAPWLPLYLLVIFLFHPLLGAVALVGALLLAILALANERSSREPAAALQKLTREASRHMDDSVRNAEVLAALGMVPALTRRWASLNEQVVGLQSLVASRGGLFGSASRFVRQLLQVLMLAAGAYLVIDQHVTSGVMIAATILLGRAMQPLDSLIGHWRSLQAAIAAYTRLNTLLARHAPQQAATPLPTPVGRLTVEKLGFAFSAEGRAVLRGVSFDLSPGDSLGLVGPSASGKSTLVRLLVGVWQPVTGTVRLDGADVSRWPRETLGPHIGYVPQDVELFAGTVADNIGRMGQADAEAVVAAARLAQVHDMVLRLPQGYDTWIGPGGRVLSGGQRQRIALARALLGQPRLVVLDEPNANLDGEGEQLLVATLGELKRQGVTVIVVSHRPSLLAGVDKLLVLREGMVDQLGPRTDVLAALARAGNLPRPGLAAAGGNG